MAPIISDLDQDGRPEIIVAYSGLIIHRLLVAYRGDGSIFPGWPVTITSDGGTQPVAGDIDGDGAPDIVVKARNRLVAFHGDGTAIAGFPREVNDQSYSGTTEPCPAIGDIDGDGHVDLVAPAVFDRVHVFGLAGPFNAREMDWAMFQHDALHTGQFVPHCGNGARSFGEECDDGNLSNGDACTDQCVLPLCAATPALLCTSPSMPGGGAMDLGDSTRSRADRVTWRWSRDRCRLPKSATHSATMSTPSASMMNRDPRPSASSARAFRAVPRARRTGPHAGAAAGCQSGARAIATGIAPES